MLNNPDLSVPFNNLRFGTGNLVFAEPEPGKLTGTLGGTGWSFVLTGAITPDDAARLYVSDLVARNRAAAAESADDE